MEPVFNFFYHDDFGILRTAIDDNKYLFLAEDVCHALNFSKIELALGCLNNDEVSKIGDYNFINETGLYTLVFLSLNHKAAEFKRWIRDTVIPELRAKIIGNVSPAFVEAIRDNTEELLKLVRQIKDDTSALKNVKISFEEELPF